nr:DUF1524 domain-containing protein [Salinibacterium sp. ZJ454]
MAAALILNTNEENLVSSRTIGAIFLAAGLMMSAVACAPISANGTDDRPVEFTEEAPAAPDIVTAPDEQPSIVADGSATGTLAVDVLASLPVKGKASQTGYDREGQFGSAWLDVDRNGCDTRNDMLARDLTNIEREGPCKVMSGDLDSPYSGEPVDFVRGNTTSTLVQIDHVVALANGWQTGAQQLSAAQRLSFANDPMNLLAVDGFSNQQKGAGDAATWLPASKPFRCEYVARQVSVKATYGLWVTQAEHDAIARVLASCPQQPAFASAFAAPPDPAAAQPAPAPAPVPAPAAAQQEYANCTAVRAAGAAPIHAADPGYGLHLDRDGDGTGCE